ncbi:MAG: glycosyltransferase [Clostridia bacterium]|nr:glycosyltransferase [Clostridia bacterium]
MSEQTRSPEEQAQIDSLLQRLPYDATTLPALPAYTGQPSPKSAKLKKAARLLFRAGPFGLLKAVHRKIVPGSINRFIRIGKKQRKAEEGTVFFSPVTFSILVPLYNTPLPFLNDMIASVQAQTYPHWELCLADGSDEEHGEVGSRCLELAEADARIVYRKLENNEGISGNTNACIAMATGAFISLFDHDDILHPSALFETMKAVEEKNADMVYTDEATFVRHRGGTVLTFHYKPDFGADTLRANNYICHFTSFSRKLLEKAGTFRSEYDGSQDHDMMLRLTEHAEHIVHIPKLLYFWRSHKESVASDISSKPYAIDAGQRAVHDSVVRVTGRECTVHSSRAFPAIYNIDYALKERPKVSVLIAASYAPFPSRCLASVLRNTTYEHYEVLITRAAQDTSEADKFLASGAVPFCRILQTKAIPHNKQLMQAAAQAEGDYLVFLSEDAEILSPDWIEQLLMLAQREDVGAVGAKLLHPDGSIHHAGYVLGLGRERTVGAEHHGEAYAEIGHRGRLCFVRNVSAVSSSCLMVRRSLFNDVGGFDRSLSSCYGDSDFCLKLRERGLQNLFTPHAELVIHTPCKPCRDRTAAILFESRYLDVLRAGDPYFNPHFSHKHTDIRLK